MHNSVTKIILMIKIVLDFYHIIFKIINWIKIITHLIFLNFSKEIKNWSPSINILLLTIYFICNQIFF